MASQETTGELKAESRLPVLDGLRAISIIFVLAGHLLPLGPKTLRLNETVPAMGMSLFFALSGFLIVSLLLKNADVVEFAAKRLGRIVPLAYLYIFLVYIVLFPEPLKAAITATFLVNYFPAYLSGLNAHLWSLCVEVQFYAAIGLVVAIGGRRAIWIVWPACLAVTMCRISEGAYIHIQTHLRVDEILSGACVASVFNSGWQRPGAPWGKTFVLLAVAATWFLSASPYTGWIQYLRPYATAAMMAVSLCQSQTFVARALASASLRYVATISYALYVIHPLTVYGWLNEGSSSLRYLVKRPISFALTFTLAHLSTFYWERPCLDAVHAWIHNRRAQRFNALATKSVLPGNE